VWPETDVPLGVTSEVEGCGVARLHRQWTVIVSDSVSLLVRKIIEKVVDVFERLLILEFRDAIAEVYPEVVSDIFS